MLIDAASYWLNLGIAPIPIQYKGKRPAVREWRGFQKRLPTQEEITEWFGASLRNIAIITGWTGLVVIDFDTMAAYQRWQLWTARQGRATEFVANSTYKVRTARGVHVYVRLPYPEVNRHLEGIDVKATGGYVLTAPSVHPSGVEYTAFDRAFPILQVGALSEILPAVLLERNTEYRVGVAVPGMDDALRARLAALDPWVSVRGDGCDSGVDLVTKIRRRFHLGDFFPDAALTSPDGRWLTTHCPLHDDHNPSFWVDTRRGICGCFSGCTPQPLDVINLYARMHGLTNHDAILTLGKML